MISRYLIIFLSILSGELSYSQNDTVSPQPTETNSVNPYSFLVLDTNPKIFIPAYKPILGFGRGVFTFFGDIKDNYHSNPLVGRHAWIATVSRRLNSFLNLYFQVTYGKLTGNTQLPSKYYNFQSEILAGGFHLSYNFKHLIKKPSSLMPYVSIGFESFEFNSKADMYDAYGNLYHYWSDGTIRDIPESSGSEFSSNILQRDYKYETDLREMNLDGLGKYPQIAFAVPVDIGAEFQYTDRLSLRIGATYHFTFSNNVDNISDAGAGNRKGNGFSDKFLVTYVTLHYDLFSPKKLSTLESHYSDVSFDLIDKEDEDGDGVIDLWDESPGTPPGVSVDSRGRPYDKDNDGNYDYTDKEAQSVKNANVDLEGVTFTEDRIPGVDQAQNAIQSNRLCDIYPKLCDEAAGVKKFKTYYLEIPDKFKPVDLNNDDYISVDELNMAIDKFFDFGTNFTIEDIYELNEFFFEQ